MLNCLLVVYHSCVSYMGQFMRKTPSVVCIYKIGFIYNIGLVAFYIKLRLFDFFQRNIVRSARSEFSLRTFCPRHPHVCRRVHLPTVLPRLSALYRPAICRRRAQLHPADARDHRGREPAGRAGADAAHQAAPGADAAAWPARHPAGARLERGRARAPVQSGADEGHLRLPHAAAARSVIASVRGDFCSRVRRSQMHFAWIYALQLLIFFMLDLTNVELHTNLFFVFTEQS